MTDPRTAQLLEEERADGEAAAAHLEKLRVAAASGDITLPRANRYISAAYSAVRDHIAEELEVKTRGVGGKYKNWLRALPPELSATLALRTVLKYCMNIGDPATAQILCTKLGTAYEMEVRIAEAFRVNPLYMQRVQEQIKERGTQDVRHITKVYNFAYEQVMKGYGADRLSQTDRLHLGKFGIDACHAVGIIEQVRKTTNTGKQFVYYELQEEAWEYLTGYDSSDVRKVLEPAIGAMQCTPDPWTTLVGGGYLSERRKMTQPLMSLARIRPSEQQRLMREFTAEKMPEVFQCANYLQGTDFALHMPTVAAIRRLWEAGGGVMDVPTRECTPIPEFPFPDTWIAEDAPEEERVAVVRWKRTAAKIYEERVKWRSKVREIGGFLRIARNSTPERFWLPVFCDTRGRWYYRGIVNPQGSDLSRATIHFARKKALGERGLFWLRVSIANHFGYDKARFAQRADWTIQNWTTIERALDAPEDFPDVWGTSAPWSMFAAAWELREALNSGSPESYRTGIAVHMDATCSGLQHFSALMRDPVGARFTNVTDSGGDVKEDIYTEVSDVTLAKAQEALDAAVASMEDDLVANNELRRYAELWLSWGVPRALAKKPVMTYSYGATVLGCAQDIAMYLQEEGLAVPEDVSEYKLCQYLAKKLFQGVEETVPSAPEAMHWLKSVVRSIPGSKRMEWRSPTGFLVQHDYQAFDEVRVAIRSCGLDRVTMRRFKDSVRMTPMVNAVAPNFVHALDAAHLTKTAIAMEAAGESMVAIHDSFGTHPSSVDNMHRCIRETFADMYSDDGILERFLWEVGGTGEVPPRGTLDLSSVLSSEFFFS